MQRKRRRRGLQLPS